MGEIKIIEEATSCELCAKEVYLGSETIYKQEIFWACLSCNEKIEELKAKEAKKDAPKWAKVHKEKLSELKAKIKKK